MKFKLIGQIKYFTFDELNASNLLTNIDAH